VSHRDGGHEAAKAARLAYCGGLVLEVHGAREGSRRRHTKADTSRAGTPLPLRTLSRRQRDRFFREYREPDGVDVIPRHH
jgi:hypothetical protein